MKDVKFERELKLLLCYIREYGIQHSNISIKEPYESDIHNRFVANVHKGFMFAQRNVIDNLIIILKEQKQIKAQIKEANKVKDKSTKEECCILLKKLKFQEYVFRKIMDSIAWIILGFEVSDIRRLYGGEELIDITDSNIESCIAFSENIFSNNPMAFALISDLTSFVQTGDILLFEYGKKLEVVELKSGDTNAKVLDLLDFYIKNQCDYFLDKTFQKEGHKFEKQFMRTVKQLATESEVVNTLKTGQGIDRLTGLNVDIVQEHIELDTFTDVVLQLIETARKKGYAICVIENCLHIGVYFNNKFPSTIFYEWMENRKIETPIYDLSKSIWQPLAFPIFLQPFSENTILDILNRNITILMTIDINVWLAPLKKDGYQIKWLSEKQTRKNNAKIKGIKPFSIKGKSISIEKDDYGMILQGGIFGRMFTLFNTPSAMRKYIIELHKKVAEKNANEFSKSEEKND